MAANHFGQIAQELLKQKQLMDNLLAENRELRERIADLRTGRGIFVDINGVRFALRDDSSLAQTTPASSGPVTVSLSTSTVATFTLSATPPDQHIVDTPTEVIPEITAQLQEQGVQEQVSPSNNDEDKNTTNGESTFLEEILIDEFASALSSPNAVWQDPTEKKPSQQQRKPHEPIDEKQKEALRRELTGSYLLE
jgi:hypothetical protein